MAKVLKTQVEFEGRFYHEYVVVEGEELPPWAAGAKLFTVGRPQPRVDGAERVTGAATFTHDVRLPGMLYGKILRSPHPHARIRRLDAGAAERLPGVRAVLHAGNTPEISWRGGTTKLFDTTLRYPGDEVACVVADEEEPLEEALSLIEVEYEALPFVLDPEAALKPGAPRVHPSGNLVGGKPEVYWRGDVERGLAEADVVVEGTFRTQTALHNCMETHGSVARWEGEMLTVWDSTQHIFGVRAQVAKALGLPLSQVRVIKQSMGGGFGSKNQAGKYTVMAALAARQTGRPVQILLDRREENLATGNRPASVQTLKVGAKRDGMLTAIDHRSIVNVGAYALFPASTSGPTRRLYRCPNVRTEDRSVFTNLGPFSAFRAPGYVEGTFALESMMDELAQRLDLDPLELRLRNYAEVDPITGKPYTTKGLRQAYARGAELIGWSKRQEKRERATGRRRVGFGMASQIWGGNGGPPAYALVKINPDGTATVVTGTQDIGTGTRTVLTQVAAEALRFPLSQVRVELGDTQLGVYAPLSAGSMTLASVGPAVRVAAEEARRQLLDVGAQVLELPEEQLALEDGQFVDGRTGERTPVGAIFEKLGNYMIMGRGARGPNPEGKSVNTFGAQFAQVEVEVETGCVRVNRMVAVHESGRVINPLAVRSQLEGGVIQGLGYALFEQRFVDPRQGLVLNAELENYKVPTVQDVPEIVAEMVDLPDKEANNLGVKGVGEPPIIPTAAAIANAVADALGRRIWELPLSADRVLMALNCASEHGVNDGSP